MRVRVHGQPGEHIVSLQDEAQHVGRHVRIERMFRGGLRLHHRIIVVLQDLEAVQMQRYPQEHWAHVFQVRTG